MRIISWNINGIRAVVKKGFIDWLKKDKADIICLQEIKISEKMREKEIFDFPGYSEYWFSAERPGYSGTLILIHSDSFVRLGFKTQPNKRIINGIGVDKFDSEGRVQTIELSKFYLINAYFPNANHELSRLNYKLEFNDFLLKYIKKLDKKKPVIITGDFNVAHKEIDLARPKDNFGNPGFTHEERAWIDKFEKLGYIDTFRYLNKDKIQYSWWSYRFKARERNIGWRIDYFFVSKRFIKNIKNAFILDKIYGSDHCPVGIEINL